MYHVNNLKHGERSRYGPKARSRIAKADYIFFEMVKKTGDQRGITYVIASAIFSGGDTSEFCRDDGFVNVLRTDFDISGTTLVESKALDDPKKYLMIPYDELPEKQRPVVPIALATMLPKVPGVYDHSRGLPDYNLTAPNDLEENLGWRQWAKNTYGDTWDKIQEITDKTEADFK